MVVYENGGFVESPVPPALKPTSQSPEGPETGVKVCTTKQVSKNRKVITGLASFTVLTLLTILVVCLIVFIGSTKPPHIVLILADDLGWGDVGWHNSDLKTPHLTKLAKQGVILNQFYSQPICTASRAALLSGRYPFKLGLQGSRPIVAGDGSGLPLQHTLLPKTLKESGYTNYLIGKWHLGFEEWASTPTRRGFDYFLGFYNGMQDYFYHTTSKWDAVNGTVGYDMRRETPANSSTGVECEILWDANGTFSGLIYTEDAKRIISSHDASIPMFLMLSFPHPHSPIQIPQEYTSVNDDIHNSYRRKYAGLVSSMDDSVGEIVAALESKGIMEDTVIIFMSDNGGTIYDTNTNPNGASNFPLRGDKGGLWEGGVRVPAFISGRGVPRGRVSNGLMHITDWYPTIVALAQGNVNGLDGVDQTSLLMSGGVSSRSSFIYDIDPVFRQAAVRSSKWKLIVGNSTVTKVDTWYPPLTEESSAYPTPQPFQSVTFKKIMELVTAFKSNNDTCKTSLCFFPSNLYDNVQLFNIEKDEFEFKNVADDNRDIVDEHLAMIDIQMKSLIRPTNLFQLPNPAANPNYFNGTWMPYLP